jgi:hypothetical protein
MSTVGKLIVLSTKQVILRNNCSGEVGIEKKNLLTGRFQADSKGFEPLVLFKVYSTFKRAHSTTLTTMC